MVMDIELMVKISLKNSYIIIFVVYEKFIKNQTCILLMSMFDSKIVI